MDRIILSGSSFWCHVGIEEEERERRQLILIDLHLFTDTALAAASDDIKKSIDYTAVHSVMKEEATGKSYKLIETLAERVASRILEEFSLGKVFIRVKKPSAMAHHDVEYSAVEITREKK